MSRFKPEEVRVALIEKYGNTLIAEAEAIDKEGVERDIHDAVVFCSGETLDSFVEKAREFITVIVYRVFVFRLSAEQIEFLKQMAIKYPTATISPCEGGTPTLIKDVIESWCLKNDIYPECILGELYKN